MIRVLNYKPFQRGSIMGFFDLGIAGLTIKGCRLMTGAKGFWFSFPQREGKDESGAVKYFDIIFMSSIERDHLRRLIVAELEAQGHIQHVKATPAKPKAVPSKTSSASNQGDTFRHPDTGENLSEYVTNHNDDDDQLPF